MIFTPEEYVNFLQRENFKRDELPLLQALNFITLIHGSNELYNKCLAERCPIEKSLLQKLLERDLEKHGFPKIIEQIFSKNFSSVMKSIVIKSIYRFFERKALEPSKVFDSTWDYLEEQSLIDFALVTELRLSIYNIYKGQTSDNNCVINDTLGGDDKNKITVYVLPILKYFMISELGMKNEKEEEEKSLSDEALYQIITIIGSIAQPTTQEAIFKAMQQNSDNLFSIIQGFIKLAIPIIRNTEYSIGSIPLSSSLRGFMLKALEIAKILFSTLADEVIIEYANIKILSNELEEGLKLYSSIGIKQEQLKEIGIKFFENGKLELAISCYEVLSEKLLPQARTIKHTLASLYNVKVAGFFEYDDKEQFEKCLDKCRILFESALNIESDEPISSNLCAAYATLLFKYHNAANQEEYIKIQELLIQAIKLQNDYSKLWYSQLEKLAAVEPIQQLLDKKSDKRESIEVAPRLLACYLLVRLHAMHDNKEEAKAALEKLKAINLSFKCTSDLSPQQQEDKVLALYFTADAYKKLGCKNQAAELLREVEEPSKLKGKL
ncbi:hypothetical protein NF27_JZ00010 [Candidatus Jidaibacter acanthamoeba]|uniref:Uncharacterized protein n=1 Tax=Candidatus Jidaibacter acanthamoebae TaxID=86105 RepID=A0A0C1MQ25_9RICK|nr:hypothetical protein NF27_JZ00010 [Candidatus Jidaibacter acanthamoeba]